MKKLKERNTDKQRSTPQMSQLQKNCLYKILTPTPFFINIQKFTVYFFYFFPYSQKNIDQ